MNYFCQKTNYKYSYKNLITVTMCSITAEFPVVWMKVAENPGDEGFW